MGALSGSTYHNFQISVKGFARHLVTQIESGVAPGAMVVVDGADRLREGAKVEVVTRDAPVPASPDAAKRGPRGKDGGERRNQKAKSG